MLENLSVDDAEIKNASVTLATKGQPGTAVYQKLNAQIKQVERALEYAKSLGGNFVAESEDAAAHTARKLDRLREEVAGNEERIAGNRRQAAYYTKVLSAHTTVEKLAEYRDIRKKLYVLEQLSSTPTY